MKENRLKQYLLYYYCLLTLVVAVITVNQIKIVRLYITKEHVAHSRLDYDAFRCCHIEPKLIKEVVQNRKKDHVAYLTYQMLANDYDMLKDNGKIDPSIWKQIKKVEETYVYKELYDYYHMIFADLKYFPVPLQKSGLERVDFDDSWGAQRTFGGERRHEGCDIMTSNNIRGFFPIISVSDGVVEKKGWLSQGGNRIGIRAPGGAYFYYAHLYDYASDLKEGDLVKAGQLLGFMGDSGYGEEGTIGQFDVHLHFGIYLDSKEGEMSVNPYYILKYLESYKLIFDY